MRRIIRRLLGIHVLRQDHDRILAQIGQLQHELGRPAQDRIVSEIARLQRERGDDIRDGIVLEVDRLRHEVSDLRSTFLARAPDAWAENKRVCADFRGLRIWINLGDVHIGRTILNGWYEDALVDFVLSHLGEGGTFVDIGANVGAYTLQAARAVGSVGRVFAFEPRPDTFAMLKRSVGDNGFDPCCRLFPAGLGDHAGAARIRHWAGNDGASFVQEGATAGTGDPIELTTLDAIDFGERVDFLKIDVEGFETKVLRGGRDFFARYKPPILTEVFPGVLRDGGGSSAEEYLSLLHDYGYAMRMVDDHGLGRTVEPAELRVEADFPGLFNVVCFPR